MSPALFKSRSVVWIVALSGLSLLVGILLTVFRDDLAQFQSHDADTYSYSAIGHHGFAAFLRQLGVPVIVSRHHSGLKAAETLGFRAETSLAQGLERTIKWFRDSGCGSAHP